MVQLKNIYWILIVPICLGLFACGDDDKPAPFVAAVVSCQQAAGKCPDGSDAVANPAPNAAALSREVGVDASGAAQKSATSCPFVCRLDRPICPSFQRVCADGSPAQQVTGGLGGCSLACPGDANYQSTSSSTATAAGTAN